MSVLKLKKSWLLKLLSNISTGQLMVINTVINIRNSHIWQNNMIYSQNSKDHVHFEKKIVWKPDNG